MRMCSSARGRDEGLGTSLPQAKFEKRKVILDLELLPSLFWDKSQMPYQKDWIVFLKVTA